VRLTAVEIGYFEDDEVLEVGIAGTDERGARRTLSLQRATYEPEEQDIEGGMDTCCVSTEAGATLYGCLRHVRLEEAVLTLEFLPEDAEVLEIDATVEADLGAADTAELAGKLRDVLAWGAPGKRPELHF
jgi:hypothetical protein